MCGGESRESQVWEIGTITVVTSITKSNYSGIACALFAPHSSSSCSSGSSSSSSSSTVIVELQLLLVVVLLRTPITNTSKYNTTTTNTITNSKYYRLLLFLELLIVLSSERLVCLNLQRKIYAIIPLSERPHTENVNMWTEEMG